MRQLGMPCFQNTSSEDSSRAISIAACDTQRLCLPEGLLHYWYSGMLLQLELFIMDIMIYELPLSLFKYQSQDEICIWITL